MLRERSVVIDLEGFRYKKSNFIVKEIAITTSEYSDSLIFYLQSLSTHYPKLNKKRTLVNTILARNSLGNGDYLYLNLNQIIQSFVLRNPKRCILRQRKREG